jgi:hypothetical protein
LQAANNEQQIRNRNEIVALKLTRVQGMTEAQLQTTQNATRGPTAAAGPQPCKFEENNSKQQTTNL